MSKEVYGEDRRRDNFRLKYGNGPRPALKLEDGTSYNVIDVSERGVRFSYTGGVVRNPVKGVFSFMNGKTTGLEGSLLRVQNNEICIYLNNIIPIGRILEEQRHIHRISGNKLETSGEVI